MLLFKDITVESKTEIESFLVNSNLKMCNYKYQTLFLWEHAFSYKYCIYNEFLYIRLKYNKFDFFYPPVGKGDFIESLNILFEYTKSIGIALKLTSVEEDHKNILLDHFKDEIQITDFSSNSDYIYLASDLANLNGKKFKDKRNMVNNFCTNYDHSFKVLCDLDINLIYDYVSALEKSVNETEEEFEIEKKAILKAVDNRKELGIYVGCLFVKDVIIAITFGYIVNDTLHVPFEKADIEYKGAFQTINYYFSSYFADKIKYIDREEDLGHPGLRKAKQSYNPIEVVQNYNIYFKKLYSINVRVLNDLKDAKGVWNHTFNDGDFSTWFYDNVDVKPYGYVFENKTIAIANVLELNANNYSFEYLYALATCPKFQKLGLMSNMIGYIEYNSKSDFVFLIPGSDKVHTFYNNLGYTKIIRAYYSNCHLDSNQTEANLVDLDINKLNSIYENNLKDFKYSTRTTKYWNNIIDFIKIQDGFVYMSEDSYLFVLLEDGKYIIKEHVGNTNIINNVLNKLGIKFIDVVSYKGDTPLYGFIKFKDNNIIDNKFFLNLLFE
ncbi:MAG: DUF2156 domain-containing protein [Anaeroplasmataceae bacterium]